jgi:hypothetical protein
MRKPDRVEAKLDQLHDLRASGDPRAIAPFLSDKSNLIAAKAARIAGDLRLMELESDLVHAFERLMRDPAVLDKGCSATTAIVEALYAMEHSGHAVFLAGIRHMQLEPSFGPPVDAAVTLRGMSALGLTQTRYDGIMYELVRLLTDSEWKARLMAARALGCMNDPAAAPLLQYKAMSGDEEWEVTAECFAALLAIDSGRYLPFVDSYTEDVDERAADAAMTGLAASRGEAPARTLAAHWSTIPHRRRTALINALAMSRAEPALDCLLSALPETNEPIAREIARAVEQYHSGDAVRERLSAALRKRGDVS